MRFTCTLHSAIKNYYFDSALEAYIFEEVCDYIPTKYEDDLDEVCKAVYQCWLKSEDEIDVGRLAYYVAVEWENCKDKSPREILSDYCFSR